MFAYKGLYKFIIILVSFGVLIVATDFFTRQWMQSGQTEVIALTNAKKKSLEREGILTQFFTHSEHTLNALRNSGLFKRYIDHPNILKHEFEELALVVANSQRDIMKIRYIDANGWEKIRIDRLSPNESATIVPENELQNKAHRYFFYESFLHAYDHVWFSNIDLNEDDGEVETPYKPTLRAVVSLSKNDQFDGILVINYFVQPLFEELAQTPLYDMTLIDDEGEILIHHDKSRNWTRYTGEINFLTEHPALRPLLYQKTYQTDHFFIRRLNLPSGQKLFLVLTLNKEYFAFQEELSDKTLLYSAGITLMITVLFGWLFTHILGRFFADYVDRGENIDKLTSLNQRISHLLVKNQTYMDMASDGIHILDTNGNLVAFSHSFASMLGYNEKEMESLNVTDWEAKLTPNGITDAMTAFKYEPKTLETQHRCKDGSIIDVEIHCKWIVIEKEELFYASSRDITVRLRMEKELQRLATTDMLTELPSRRLFIDRLNEEHARVQRDPTYPVTIVMLDIDHFKSVNDTYGHNAGDKVLKTLSSILQDELRRVDLVSRLGGEEFGLILAGTDEQAALHVATRICRRVSSTPFYYGDHSFICSVSMGISQIYIENTTPEEILEHADRALYQAKNAGRNRVEVYRAKQPNTLNIDNSYPA